MKSAEAASETRKDGISPHGRATKMTSKREQSELEPKTAEQYRQAADAHAQTLKDFWKRFLVSGLFVVAAIIIIFACLAWFVSNNQVKATGASISAKAARYALTVSNDVSGDASAHEGVYDAESNLNVVNAMLVNSASNFNNNVNGGELGPGSAGMFDLQVQPLADDLGDVKVAISMEAAIKGSPDADKLNNLLKGHILFFAVPDGDAHAGQFYTSPLLPVDNIVTIPSSMFDGANKKTISLKIYWVWTEHFRNLIATGGSRYDNNLFETEGSDGSDGRPTSDYWNFNTSLNDGKNCFFNDESEVESYRIDNSLNNARYTVCSTQYDAADDYIGNSISYIKVSFSVEESSNAENQVSGQ